MIEVSSVAVVAWQFAARDDAARAAREKVTLRAIAVSFVALAGYVLVQAVRTLLGETEAQPSTVGVVLAAASVVIMPGLSYAQRRAGRLLGSATAVADSKCSYLTGVLLLGLVLNASLGWWWADPVAALVIAAMAIKEGREAWRGDACCTPASTLTSTPSDVSADGCADDCCDAG